jgi:hypothetical protein
MATIDKSNRNNGPMIAIILLVAVLVIGGLYFMSNDNYGMTTDATTTTNTGTPAAGTASP